MFGSISFHPLQNVVFAVELQKTQRATLAERERVNAELLERVEALSAERRQADDKLASLQAELDRESAARRGQEHELDRLWEELEKERSEFGKDFELDQKDSELQAASKALEAASKLAEDIKAELSLRCLLYRRRRQAPARPVAGNL